MNDAISASKNNYVDQNHDYKNIVRKNIISTSFKVFKPVFNNILIS